jgi:hypothetical protein
MTGAAPLPVYSINAPSFVPGVDFSDQLNYWHAGYGAVMITDTAFYRIVTTTPHTTPLRNSTTNEWRWLSKVFTPR